MNLTEVYGFIMDEARHAQNLVRTSLVIHLALGPYYPLDTQLQWVAFGLLVVSSGISLWFLYSSIEGCKLYIRYEIMRAESSKGRLPPVHSNSFVDRSEMPIRFMLRILALCTAAATISILIPFLCIAYVYYIDLVTSNAAPIALGIAYTALYLFILAILPGFIYYIRVLEINGTLNVPPDTDRFVIKWILMPLNSQIERIS